MDDTKKLIEKYKRELMELSAKQKKTPKIIGYVDGDNSFLSGLQADIVEDPAPEKTEAPRDNFDMVFGESSIEKNEAPRENPGMISERSSSEKTAAPRENPGMISEETGSENPKETCSDLEMSRRKNGSEDTAKNRNTPDVIFERADSDNPSGSITEIIDEYTPEPPKKSREISGNEAAAYTKIPSTEQVRGEITQNSEPQNNIIENNVSGITNNSAATPKADSADAIRTTPEQAERLNDQPVSGTDPDEQLTGRSFEGTQQPPDVDISMEQGSRAEPIDYPEQNFSNFEEFEQVNTGRGSLMFKVYTGREAVVIEGAECVITKKIGEETRTIAELVTDNSGQTPSQELPAPPKELSQHSENTIQPFALYDAQVTKPGFVRVVLKDVPVFDGVQSVQRVFMIVE